MTALHPPAPPALAKPTGAWRTLSAAMTAEIPAITGRPVPVACAPGAGLGHPACYLPAHPGHRGRRQACSASAPPPPTPPARPTANATRSCGAP